MKVKSDREESSPYKVMLAAHDEVQRCKELKIYCQKVKLQIRGGMESKTMGLGALAAIRALARFGMKIGRIEVVTPIPTDSTRKAGGRRL